MSSIKPLRRFTSDRGEDDCLSKINFLKSYTQLALHQLACACDLCEGRAWVDACRPCTGHVYLYDSRKIKCIEAKKAGKTGMEDQNPC
jgi:hypothetical protein